MKKRKKKFQEELIFLDECVNLKEIEILINEKWGIPVVPVNMMQLQGKNDKQIADHLASEFEEFNRYFITGNRQKGTKYFLPSKKCCVIRLSPEVMKWEKAKKIKIIKAFLDVVRSQEGLTEKELVITPGGVIKKFPSRHINIIKYKHFEA